VGSGTGRLLAAPQATVNLARAGILRSGAGQLLAEPQATVDLVARSHIGTSASSCSMQSTFTNLRLSIFGSSPKHRWQAAGYTKILVSMLVE
jgi:hypothetical protein